MVGYVFTHENNESLTLVFKVNFNGRCYLKTSFSRLYQHVTVLETTQRFGGLKTPVVIKCPSYLRVQLITNLICQSTHIVNSPITNKPL